MLQQINALITGFLSDTPPCSALTCPEMRASEWQFLCAVHEQPKSCCAIDYCCHTLDWAVNIVTSQKIFPSRLSLGGEAGGESEDGGLGKGAAATMGGQGVKHLVNIFRRLHRIFAHAWFQHRGVLLEVENQMGLYVLFKTVCDVYELLPAENYKLPPEAEGLDEESGHTPSSAGAEEVTPVQVMKRDSVVAARPLLGSGNADEHGSGSEAWEEGGFGTVNRVNPRRHVRQSPSVGSSVGTVMEADEDDATDVTSRMAEMRMSPDRASDEVQEIPLVVETYPDAMSTEHGASLELSPDESSAHVTIDIAPPGQMDLPTVNTVASPPINSPDETLAPVLANEETCAPTLNSAVEATPSDPTTQAESNVDKEQEEKQESLTDVRVEESPTAAKDADTTADSETAQQDASPQADSLESKAKP